MSLSDFRIYYMALRDFEEVQRLGEGAFSQVYKARRRADGNIYALKRVKLSGLKPRERENALNEVRILASISHPNIIAYKEAFIDPDSNTLWYSPTSIVMELADGGDLLQQINAHKRKGTLFSETQVWSLTVQTLRGLKALHDLRVLHRDIKCANVFMCRDGTVKLGDMNVAKVAKAGLVYTQTGTPYYASPEVWKDQPYDSKSDLWSMGCVVYEMITLQPPFRGSDMSELYKKVTRGQYADLPSTYSQDLNALVRTLLQVNPVLRPSCDRLLTMPIVARHTVHSEESSEQSSLLSTIKVPRDLRALGDQLPAPHYLPSPREVLSVFSNRQHEREKPPSHDQRSRNLLAPPTQQREGRSLSAARPDIVGHHRNLSSDSRQLPDVFRAKSKDPTRLPLSPHPPAGLVHTPNSQVLRDPTGPKVAHPRANIFASQR